ncbi:YbjN domain-containing protein [Deinococcus sp. KSM4-11]|uniref:YbjN domain-containing protein n=1 Tax=Deinococcus sp. KSM4-11 TaxID=2568654 RepID=UPI0010A4A915|nr:YbjN domain-containing protein [Deinococcus sp. KSM4-11]THF86507.1 YbjN domain-containing protein [Deinococcus sp. KSM4-11]
MRLSALSALTTALFLTGAALAGGAGAPATGSGQVQAATPAAVAAILRAAGYTVTMNPADPDKDPSMTIRLGDDQMDVWLSGCKAGTCARVTASSSWDYSDQGDLDTGVVNDWNANYYTQAYTYEGGYYLDSTMPLRGGYTAAALKAWMTDYLSDVRDYGAKLP